MSGGKAHAEAHAQDGDQKHASPRELSQYEIGKQDAHIKLDKAERIERVNKIAAEEAKKRSQKEFEEHARPTQIAEAHGNKPSRGAKIDQEIEDEERAQLERQGKA
ncbi:hypothetical protein RQP46_003805 [Phenoliferia psychrophenolica]